jgi:hypothetical protein
MKHKIFFNENPLDLLPNSLCRVLKRTENHFFNADQNIIFTGWLTMDYVEGTILYQFTGKIDGQLVDQWLDEEDFMIIKRAKDYGSN